MQNNQAKNTDISFGDIMLISIIRTILLYVFIIMAIRLMGKRQISDMQPSELVVTMVISDIASLPMQNTSQPLLSGVIPVMILIALEITTSVIMMKSKKIRKAVCGSPVIVINDGRLLQNQMRRLRLTVDDLCAQLRQQNVFSIQDVQYCIVETNGTVSVLEKPQKRQPTADDLGIMIEDNKIETVVISDGEIVNHSLQLCGHKTNDVFKILRKKNIKLKDVFIMTMDSTGNYNIIKKDENK